MTLASLAACEAIIYCYYSERLEIPFDHLSVDVEGDLDLRGGLDMEDVRAGFDAIRIVLHVDGTESPERYAHLHEAVERNCPVLDSLANPVNVITTLDLAGRPRSWVLSWRGSAQRKASVEAPRASASPDSEPSNRELTPTGVPVRALERRALGVPVMGDTGGHSRSTAVTRSRR